MWGIQITIAYLYFIFTSNNFGVNFQTLKMSCPDCKQPYSGYYYCQNCNSKRFQQNFNKWTSGNELVDNFIQDVQIKAKSYPEVIEWIPYNRLRNIQYLAQGGFSTVYKAIWLDGLIENWDKKKQQWERIPRYRI